MINVIKEKLNSLYTEHSKVWDGIGHFILAFTVLLIIKDNVKLPGVLSSVLILFLISLICAVVPMSIIALLSSVLLVSGIYNESVIALAYVVILLLIIIIVYLRFKPSDLVFILLIIVGMYFKIPFVIPVLLGFFFNPATLFATFVGILMYYLLLIPNFVDSNLEILNGFSMISKNIFANKDFIIDVVVSSVGLICSYIIRKTNIKYRQFISVNASLLISYILLFIFNSIYKLETKLLFVAWILLSFVIANLVVCAFYNSNYKKMQILEYEDESYYYYVKAIPKETIIDSNENEYNESMPEINDIKNVSAKKIGDETREIAGDYYNMWED